MENLSGWDITAIITGALYLGEVIVQQTPTEKDDNILKVIRKVLFFYLNNKKKGGGNH